MRDLVVWGVGELGQWFGGAGLRAGFRVTPITRSASPREALMDVPVRTPILVAVGETALPDVLAAVPRERSGDVILLQNELFPSIWELYEVRPTVLVPWLLKKRGHPELVGRASRVYGPHADMVRALHAELQVPCEELGSAQSLRQALVEKYTFILTINALGLERDETLGELLLSVPSRVEALAREAAELGADRARTTVDEEACVAATRDAMQALSAIKARGRTAGERVLRALRDAKNLGISTPMLDDVAQKLR